MGHLKASIYCLLPSNGTFENFDVILTSVPLWMLRGCFYPLEAFGIFSLHPVLEFESDGCCTTLSRYPFRIAGLPQSENAAMTLRCQPSLENALAKENFRGQPAPNY